MTAPKFKIYKSIICVETEYPHAGKWWDVGYHLGFMPVPIQKITHIQHGHIRETGREVLAARIMNDNYGEWIAINTPRSDIFALIERNLWPQSMKKPYTRQPKYQPWPEEL